MRELEIYDSKGNSLADPSSRANQRIQDFFFDGVRFAVDTVGLENELVCFFRARESEASRSEQYYAILRTDNKNDLNNFKNLIERRIEDRHEMIFDTSSEDTTVINELGQGKNLRSPGTEEERRDLLDLVKLGQSQATVGLGSYEEATALLRESLRETKDSKIAVVENTDSSHLVDYDLIIEKGNHVGISYLESTDADIEEMVATRGPDELGGGSGPVGSGNSGPSTPFLIGGIAGVVVIGVIAGLAAGCAFGGFSAPLIESSTGMDFCGTQSYAITDTNGELVDNSKITINGTLRQQGDTMTNKDQLISINLSVEYGNGTVLTSSQLVDGSDSQDNSTTRPFTLYSDESTVSINDGDFNHTINLQQIEEPKYEPTDHRVSGDNKGYLISTYRVNVSWRGNSTIINVPTERALSN